jgi:hypothetical protein
MPEGLIELPFDQFTRHNIMTRVADSIRRHHGPSRLAVLDVGGFPCLTAEFLDRDRVVVVDLVDGKPEFDAEYLRADGAALPFPSNSFDLVSSLDSLEHVPRDRREAYILELLRVSRGFVLIVAPFDQEETVLAERLLAEFVRVVNQEEQPQLREHREHGLPSLDKWSAFLHDRDLPSISFSSGFVYNWLPMMLLKHYVFSLPDSDELQRALDRFYNVTLQASDAREPGYRHGLLVSKVPESPVLDEMQQALAPSGAADRLEVIERMEQIGLLLKLADLHVASKRDDRLRDALVDKERHIVNLEASVREEHQTRVAMQDRIRALEGNLAAAEQRAGELTAHIEAIRSGRVMQGLAVLDQLRGKRS